MVSYERICKSVGVCLHILHLRVHENHMRYNEFIFDVHFRVFCGWLVDCVLSGTVLSQ